MQEVTKKRRQLSIARQYLMLLPVLYTPTLTTFIKRGWTYFQGWAYFQIVLPLSTLTQSQLYVSK